MQCCPSISLRRLVAAGVAIISLALAKSIFAQEAGMEQDQAVTNLMEFQRLGAHEQLLTCNVHLAGTVAWANSVGDKFVLVDGSGAELIDLTGHTNGFHAGQKIVLDGICSGGGAGSDRRIRDALVVDNDGVHAKEEKKATITLGPGKQPLRLCWFTRETSGALEVEYEGPGVPRQIIPDSVLFRSGSAPGLNYRTFEGDWWQLPSFESLTPTGSGISTNFDLSVRPRRQMVSLEFSGDVEIREPGRYTFSISSEGGSQLWMPLLHVTMAGETSPLEPRSISIGQENGMTGESCWATMEGVVSFVSDDGQPELELTSAGGHIRAEVDNPADLPAALLPQSRVRVTGICRNALAPDGQRAPGLIWIPSASQIEILSSPPQLTDSESSAGDIPTLTNVEQIKLLKREEALRGYPVDVRGTITWSSGSAVVIQDSTAGVFVTEVPVADADGVRQGEFWEIQGITSAQFSPLILARHVIRLGLGTIPEPLLPTWDQLINGSLDTEYVEVRGIVTDVQSNSVELLTHGGKIQLDLPETNPERLKSLDGVLARLRGCLWAVKDQATHVFKVGEVQLHNASIQIEQPSPADPFAAPLKRPDELLLFDAQAGAFQRVKISGQIIHEQSGEYFLMGGGGGLRFAPRTAISFAPGDDVEVVGFPELSGPSPFLREARVKKMGHSALPQPVRLSEETLLSNQHDSTLVQVDAQLTKLSFDQKEVILGMQMGTRNFVARIGAPMEFARSLRLGSTLRLTGTYSARGAGRDVDSFELLVNSPSDIQLIAQPSWWTLQRMLTAIGVLLAGLGMAVVWIGLLRRQVSQRTSQLKKEIHQREQAEYHRAVEAERSRIARDLHDDLGSSLTEISLLADAGPGRPPSLERAVKRFQSIGDKARSVVNSLDVIVWLVNPRKDVLPFFASYVASYAQEYLSTSGIPCQLRIPVDIPPIRLSAEIRHSLFLAVKESLHNIARHSHASEVVMEVTVDSDQLQIVVIDNGQGFDSASNLRGNGLANLHERLTGIGGRCQVNSRPEAGTRVVLALPLRSNSNGL